MKYYLSSYLFLILYSIFSIADLINENILLNSQGFKLNQKFKKDIKHIKISMYEVSIGLLIILINICFTIKYINYNFLPIKLINKTVDLVSCYSLNATYIYIIYIFLNFASVFLKFLKKNQKKSRFLSKNVEKQENDVKKDYLSIKGLYQNVLITGSIGSGKTYGAINNIVDFLIKNKISGIILDIKGNYIHKLRDIILKNGVDIPIKEISLTNNIKYNPLDKKELSDYELANYIRTTLEILSEVNNSDSYWLDKIENILQVFIILLRMNDEVVTFYEIHRMVLDQNYIDKKIKSLKQKFLDNKLSQEEMYKLNYAAEFLKTEYKTLDHRVISIIKSEITRITIPFVSSWNVKEKFCTTSNIDFKKEEITILNVNIGENKAIARIIAAFLKSDFQKFIMKNISNSVPKFFICDEYQEFALKSDSEFFALSREAKCISVIAMQSYTSLKNKLKDETSTDLLIQNCVNKIWFRQDDIYTVDKVIKQLGKEIKKRKTHSVSENARSTMFNYINKKFYNFNSNLTETISYSYNLENEYDTKFFTTELKTLEALILYSDGENINIIRKNFNKKEENI